MKEIYQILIIVVKSSVNKNNLKRLKFKFASKFSGSPQKEIPGGNHVSLNVLQRISSHDPPDKTGLDTRVYSCGIIYTSQQQWNKSAAVLHVVQPVPINEDVMIESWYTTVMYDIAIKAYGSVRFQ
jgi:hypothetical protein